MSEELQALQAQLKEYWGLDFKRACTVVQMLAAPPFVSHDELVDRSALSHSGVSQILAALEPFLEEHAGDGLCLAPTYRAQALALFASEVPMADPWEELARRHPALPALTQDLGKRPRPDRHLDHVAATPLTALKRALFLQRQFDLSAASILLLGDHDMTALALAHIQPELNLSVVDIDERLLAFIADLSQERGWSIKTHFSDLRVDLPSSLRGQFDLVFTDPPYTPAGIKLFLQRGICALKERDFTRLLLSYGYGEQQTTLGSKVQTVLHELRLLQEAVLPRFNHYHNAPALGNRSDLYMLRPTRRSLPAAQRVDRQAQIYTQGRLAEESQGHEIPSTLLERVAHFAEQHAATSTAAVGLPLPQDLLPSLPQIELGAYIQGVITGDKKIQKRQTLIANLYPHHADYIVRLCLLSRADNVSICAGARALSDLFAHPSALRILIESRYQLIERIQEGNAAVVVLERCVPRAGDDAASVLSRIAARSQSRLASAWREALIGWAQTQGLVLSKNEARRIIQTSSIGRVHGQSYLSEVPLYALEQFKNEIITTLTAIDMTSEKTADG